MSSAFFPAFSFVLLRDLYFSGHGREIDMNAEEWRNRWSKGKLEEENEIDREIDKDTKVEANPMILAGKSG
ncbi:unnamed protein product [Lasius platythorax]|uniref:Uncharacterized protein n=1 Tax=Lasius platythorax TaxID=488582 RepID=A0AAV2P9Q7_9HYME